MPPSSAPTCFAPPASAAGFLPVPPARQPIASAILTVLACLALGHLGRGADAPAPPAAPPTADEKTLTALLTFEGDQTGAKPVGWGGGPANTLFTDSTVVHSGKWSARIERTAASAQGSSSLTTSLPVDFNGSRIELRGYLRTEDVTGFAGLWLREDGETPNLAIDTMAKRQLKGTTEWTAYSVVLPLHPAAKRVIFGFLLSGTGKTWGDDLQLLVDGEPVWKAPKGGPAQTILDRDHEFDRSSKIELVAPTAAQVANLATLARVWGFLKYHHPKVTAGELHWDYELFRIMPAVLAARDSAEACAVLVRWIDGLGELTARPEIKLSAADAHLRPDLAWIDDEASLGPALTQRLHAVHAARPANAKQFTLSLAPMVSNPVFAHELGYAGVKLPDPGFQLLGLFRFWNIIRYWSPYRNLLDENWDAVLAEFIPRIAQASSSDAYQLEMMALIAKVGDTHANLWSSLRVRPPVGDRQLPVVVRFVEGRPVISDVLPLPDNSPAPLQRGDVILAIDGVAVTELITQWSPYYAASNEPTRLRDIARSMGRGHAGPAKLRVQRGDETLEVETSRVTINPQLQAEVQRHDLPGPTFRLLSKDVAYLKLSSVKLDDVESYVQQAAGTKGWIIDIRNYPSAFVVFALGSHFVEQPTDFASFTNGNLANPGEFTFRQGQQLRPKAPFYPGKIIILVDETSQSQAEYTTMAFRAAPGAKVIGSTTAAADGNVSTIPLPGGLSTMISGIGVFYPDKRPTQRIGIIPDLEARPTLAGIRAGRDELVEIALRQILGPEISAEEIQKIVATQR